MVLKSLLSLWLWLFTIIASVVIPLQVVNGNNHTPEFLLRSSSSSSHHNSAIVEDPLQNSCASIKDCKNCTNTYTCHWCDQDAACHAKGSFHGCSWGSSCHTKRKDNSNSSCISHKTCSECTLSSHLCHWCAFDNACHAVGSKYGCKMGVDCYSNDRCRRSQPEPFQRFVVTEMPMTVLAIFLTVMSLLLCCICVCHCCWGELKGAYDDLAAITMASAGPLMSGEHFYTTTVATTQSEEENEEFYNTQEQETSNESVVDADADADADTPTQQQQDEEANTNEQEQPQPLQEDETNDHYVLMNDSSRQNTTVDSTTTPLLHPSSRPHFHDHNIEEPATHMKALNRMCSIMYCCSVVLVVTLTATIIFFFPKPPVYNVCNDAVAWKQIMEKLALLKLDFSIEILVSVSNSNHLSVVLDEGKGSFTFEGISVGTFHIPGDNVQRMAVTDLMLIARVQPDKYQAVKMAEYYYQGKLVLKAEFEAKLRVPAFMDFTYNLDMKNLTVFVNELSDRSLCHCPSWDNNQTTTTTTTPLLFF